MESTSQQVFARNALSFGLALAIGAGVLLFWSAPATASCYSCSSNASCISGTDANNCSSSMSCTSTGCIRTCGLSGDCSSGGCGTGGGCGPLYRTAQVIPNGQSLDQEGLTLRDLPLLAYGCTPENQDPGRIAQVIPNGRTPDQEGLALQHLPLLA